MQVTELKNEGLKREFKITLKAEDLNKQVDDKIVSIASQVKMPGFRPGKVPLAVVKKKHGKEVLSEVLENAVSNASRQLLLERKLSPALEPKVEVASFSEGADLVYNLSFEIYPDLPEFDYSKITLDRSTVEVSEKDINEALERLQKARKEFTPLTKQRAAKTGDAVVIDFDGSIDGKKFAGGAGKDYRLELGSGSFISGFEDQLIGAKKDEKVEVAVTFPENYGSQELAGKDAVFAVTVNEILQAKTPDADDEFAKKIGFEDLTKLKDAISKQIEEDFSEISKIKLKKELFDKLDKELKFDIPDGMVELEYNNLINSDPEKVEKDSAEDKKRQEEFRDLSRRRVKLGIFLAELARNNSISVTEDELRKAVFDQVRNFPGQERNVVEFYQKNKPALDSLRGPILEEKAVDLIISKADITEKKTSAKELIEFQE